MIQRHQPHPPGTFASCVGCRREPKHIIVLGGSSTEPLQFGLSPERHAIECARCRRSTARYTSLAMAIDEWGAAYAQAPLQLRVVATRRARAA